MWKGSRESTDMTWKISKDGVGDDRATWTIHATEHVAVDLTFSA
jgi:hypothetical protein